MRVIFFPVKYEPDEETIIILNDLQEKLHYARIEYLQTIQRESTYQQKLSNERYKNLVRSLLKVVEG